MAQTSATQLISIAEAAASRGIHPSTIRRWISTGLIVGYRIGPRLIRVDPAELDRCTRQIPSARSAG